MFGCTKEGASKIKDVDDVCTQMDDINFMKYCYDNFDVNHDGKVSMEEANAVKTIDVNSEDIFSLKGIEYFTQLTELVCYRNNLKSLDVSKNTQLVRLDCHWNNITYLDVSKNTQLTEIVCYENNLTSLDVSKNTQLTLLDCRINNLSSLDVSKNTQLTLLDCNSNNLSSLDVSALPKLERSYFSALRWGNQNNGITITITDKQEYWYNLPSKEHWELNRIQLIWR